MSEPKFTPGPWKMHPVRGGHRHRAECIRIVNAEREPVVCVQADEVGETSKGLLVEYVSSTAEANARIIAVAPRMYELLTQADEVFSNVADPVKDSNNPVEALRHAIAEVVAKVRG